MYSSWRAYALTTAVVRRSLTSPKSLAAAVGPQRTLSQSHQGETPDDQRQKRKRSNGHNEKQKSENETEENEEERLRAEGMRKYGRYEYWTNDDPNFKLFHFSKPRTETYEQSFAKEGDVEDGPDVFRITDASIIDDLMNSDEDVDISLTVKDGKLVVTDHDNDSLFDGPSSNMNTASSNFWSPNRNGDVYNNSTDVAAAAANAYADNTHSESSHDHAATNQKASQNDFNRQGQDHVMADASPDGNKSVTENVDMSSRLQYTTGALVGNEDTSSMDEKLDRLFGVDKPTAESSSHISNAAEKLETSMEEETESSQESLEHSQSDDRFEQFGADKSKERHNSNDDSNSSSWKERRIAVRQAAMDRIVTEETGSDSTWRDSGLEVIDVRLSRSGHDLKVTYAHLAVRGTYAPMEDRRIQALAKRMSSIVRRVIATKMNLKYAPRVHFEAHSSRDGASSTQSDSELDKIFERIATERKERLQEQEIDRPR